MVRKIKWIASNPKRNMGCTNGKTGLFTISWNDFLVKFIYTEQKEFSFCFSAIRVIKVISILDSALSQFPP